MKTKWVVTVGPQLYGLKHITAGCHGSIKNKKCVNHLLMTGGTIKL